MPKATCPAKIIFIDVDGVLNSDAAFVNAGTMAVIDNACMQQFARVVAATGAAIVIASTWRGFPDFRGILMEHFTRHGIADRVIGDTPILHMSGGRGSEIRRWLRQNADRAKVRFAIIDDDPNAGTCGLKAHHFLTNEALGLTQEIADAVIAHLNTSSKPHTGLAIP